MVGKKIIVTGGSGLLGKEICKDIFQNGGTPINFDINETQIEGTDFIYCDITSPESLKSSVNEAINKYSRIDGLVNNAYPRTNDFATRFEEMKPESLSINIEWQLNSYILFCQSLIKHFSIFNKGAIVNISSIYGVVGNDWTIYENTDIYSPPAYSAIKGGIISFTRYLAALYGSKGIRINCVSPGGIFDNQNQNFVSAYEKKVPLKRLGTPEDVAPVISFLLSDKAKYVTGQNWIVDGGWTII